MAMGGDNIYQDITGIKERSADPYETYRLEELSRCGNDQVLTTNNNTSSCSGCCHDNGNTRTCLAVFLVIVVLGAVGAGVGMFIKETTDNNCQCHFTMPDGYLSQGQTGSRGSSSSPDTQSTTERSVSSTQRESTATTQQPKIVIRGTTVYTRWGRTECTNTSTKIYSGYTAGSSHSNTGGTSSVLCLPLIPQYGNIKSGRSNSYLRGAEYDASNSDLTEIFGDSIQNNDVPCAVCERTGRSTTVVFPARTVCYEGWTNEYSGYLMSSHKDDKRSIDVICVDSKPEVLHGQSSDSNGARFFFMEVDGQLPVPPYDKEAELTCVVCSK